MEFIPAPLYQQILVNLPIACVDIAIEFEQKILLLKRKNPPAQGQWWLPGGRVHKGETLEAAALRKAQVETGLECCIEKMIYTGETIFTDGPMGIPVHSINVCFLAHPRNLNIQPVPDRDHTDYQWCSQLIPDLHPYVRECLMATQVFDAR